MKKGWHRSIQVTLLVAMISGGLLSSALLAVGAIDEEMLGIEPAVNINGVWVEREVAPYAADRFEIRPEGVFVDGRQVNTEYEWDGSTLRYRFGEDIYIYTYLADSLIRQQPAHYTSSFTREGMFD